jgi:hypothetical protein
MYTQINIWIPSCRLQLAEEVKKSLLPYEAKIYDGTGYESFSKLVNHCIINSEYETIIICNDKLKTKPEDIDKILRLLEEGYGLVGLCKFAFFGFKKNLIRQIGFFDERFLGGGYEDNDIIARMKEADIAYYATEEVYRTPMPTTWKYEIENSPAKKHYFNKWRLNLPESIIRLLPEINPYDMKDCTYYTTFLSFRKSVMCRYSDESWIDAKVVIEKKPVVYSKLKKTWNFKDGKLIGGVFPVSNLSKGYHGILTQWWESHMHEFNNPTVLLISETKNVINEFKAIYPTWNIETTDLYEILGESTIKGDICVPGSIPKNKYDMIINQATMEHLYNPFDAMKNMINALKSNGYIYTHTHAQNMSYHSYPRDYMRFMIDWWYDLPKYIDEIELQELYEDKSLVHVFTCYKKIKMEKFAYTLTQSAADIILSIAEATGCKSYLELGISNGETMHKMCGAFRRCIGVDTCDYRAYNDNFEFCWETTDRFFAHFTEKVDIIFIDADHNFEQVKKDFINSLNCLSEYGIIFLHDTDPSDPEFVTKEACLDSYKIHNWIKENYPELNIITMPVGFPGLTIVNRDKDRRVLKVL